MSTTASIARGHRGAARGGDVVWVGSHAVAYREMVVEIEVIAVVIGEGGGARQIPRR